MNEAQPNQGGNGVGDLVQRVAAVEARLGVVEKTMVTAEVFQRELGALRAEMHAGFGAVRAEMHAGFGAVRAEMHAGFGQVRAETHRELAALRVDLAKLPFETVKWLLATSGIAAAIATTIYNIWFR